MHRKIGSKRALAEFNCRICLKVTKDLNRRFLTNRSYFSSEKIVLHSFYSIALRLRKPVCAQSFLWGSFKSKILNIRVWLGGNHMFLIGAHYSRSQSEGVGLCLSLRDLLMEHHLMICCQKRDSFRALCCVPLIPDTSKSLYLDASGRYFPRHRHRAHRFFQ